MNSLQMMMGCRTVADPLVGFVTTWLIADGDKSITLPLRSGFTYDMTVDWGDESSSEVTAYDDADRIHNYTTAGTKTVTITGTCQAWYFNNGGDKLKFRTVETWGDVGFTGLGLENAFRGCTAATDFGETMPAYDVTSLASTWWDCTSATSLPDISALTSVTTLSYTWRHCDVATSFPDVDALTSVNDLGGAWSYCSSATSFPDVSTLTLVDNLTYTWYGCSSATAFPDVDALTSADKLYYTWYGCSDMTTVPVLPSASTALTNTGNAFQAVGSQMEGIVADLWNATDYPNISSYANTFTGATGLTNYADIPDNWKGL